MAKYKARTEPLPSWQKFTQTIYNNWDADPGYYALTSVYNTDPNQAARAAVAWCAYYNLGIAADASERKGKRFWDYLESIYDTAKRNTERRHFRGDAGRRALAQWRSNWPQPEALAEYMLAKSRTYFDIRKRGQQVMQYGDYFYWKWCDLHDVLGYGGVDMTGSAKHSPKLPQQGAELIWTMDDPDYDGAFTTIDLEAVYDRIVAYGRSKNVPPRTTATRRFSIQEAETVCCVYKQMASGSYAYGTRTAKAVRRLGAAESDTAASMRAALLRVSPYGETELAYALASLRE